MTIGERIQMIRKNNGLSQEDLAKKILVSRQTISQWETDQTIPSIDNIYRLKEVLNVSFDEILSDDENEVVETEDRPIETYKSFSDEDEIKYMLNVATKFNKNKIIVCTLALIVLLIYSVYIQAYGISFGFILGILFMFLLQVYNVVKNRKKTINGYKKEQGEVTERYELFQDRLEYSVFKKDTLSSKYIIRKEEIDSFNENEKYYVFTRKGIIFTIRKDILNSDSLIPSFIFKTNENGQPVYKSKKVDLWSKILVAASILAIFPAMIWMDGGDVSKTSLVIEQMWKFFLFTPIPIASIVFGIWQKRKGFCVKKNIVVGIIMLVIFCIYGMFPVFFRNSYTSDYSVIINLEENTGIDFPDSGEISTSLIPEISDGGNLHSYNVSMVTYSKKDAESFFENVKKDERWIEKVQSGLIGCLPFGITDDSYDYYLLYNLDTNEVNTMPAETGKYNFAFFGYNSEDGVLKAEEYLIEVNLE